MWKTPTLCDVFDQKCNDKRLVKWIRRARRLRPKRCGRKSVHICTSIHRWMMSFNSWGWGKVWNRVECSATLVSLACASECPACTRTSQWRGSEPEKHRAIGRMVGARCSPHWLCNRLTREHAHSLFLCVCVLVHACLRPRASLASSKSRVQVIDRTACNKSNKLNLVQRSNHSIGSPPKHATDGP